jgi:hypothetical protein
MRLLRTASLTFILSFTICASPVRPPRMALISGPTIADVRVNTATVGRNEKFELAFDILDTIATNLQFPYDSDPSSGVSPGIGISVDGLFSVR